MVLNDCFRKDVKIRIAPIERDEYTPPSGIDIRWHPYRDEDKEECVATFMASTAHALPEQQRTMEDINEALANLKVVQDSITDKDEPLLVKNFGVGIYAMVDTPVYDGERDHYRSKPKEEYSIPVRKDTFDQMNSEFERRAPILPTMRKKYEYVPQHEVSIDNEKHIIMRLARII